MAETARSAVQKTIGDSLLAGGRQNGSTSADCCCW
jgi:hypothetical protein